MTRKKIFGRKKAVLVNIEEADHIYLIQNGINKSSFMRQAIKKHKEGTFRYDYQEKLVIINKPIEIREPNQVEKAFIQGTKVEKKEETPMGGFGPHTTKEDIDALRNDSDFKHEYETPIKEDKENE